MLYEKIKELRLSHNLNQVELAKKLGISKQCVSNWENGYIQPSLDMLIKLTQVFSVSADYLLGLDNKKYLEVSGLSDTEIAHLTFIINDIKKSED